MDFCSARKTYPIDVRKNRPVLVGDDAFIVPLINTVGLDGWVDEGIDPYRLLIGLRNVVGIIGKNLPKEPRQCASSVQTHTMKTPPVLLSEHRGCFWGFKAF